MKDALERLAFAMLKLEAGRAVRSGWSCTWRRAAGLLIAMAVPLNPLPNESEVRICFESTRGAVACPRLIESRSNYLPLGEMMATTHVQLLLEGFIGVDGSSSRPHNSSVEIRQGSLASYLRRTVSNVIPATVAPAQGSHPVRTTIACLPPGLPV
jgi:hypothetical protein